MSYFTQEELSCQHCGAYKFDEEFLKVLTTLEKNVIFLLLLALVTDALNIL